MVGRVAGSASAQTLDSQRSSKVATIAVAHRLARIAFAMLHDHTDFDVTKLDVEGGPFARVHDHLPLSPEGR